MTPPANGELPIATDQLVAVIYDELRSLARRVLTRERQGHTWQTTDLVHEAYLRLAGERRDSGWKSRAYFFAAAAEVIRRILVNHEEARRALKRGGQHQSTPLDEPIAAPVRGLATIDLIALDDALDELAELDARQRHIVELKFFAGLSIKQIAALLDVSPRTVDGEWALARAWLHARMARGGES